MELATALQTLQSEKILATPTDTVWGLLANATSTKAMANLQAAKGRPEGQPFLILVKSLAKAQNYAHFSAQALQIAQTYWNNNQNPPLTLVLPLQPNTPLHPACLAPLSVNPLIPLPVNPPFSIALRVPHTPHLQALLHALPFPLAAPSANTSGQPPCQTEAEIHQTFPQIATFLPDTLIPSSPDTPPKASTILDFTQSPPKLLRQGTLPAHLLNPLLIPSS